MEPGLLSRDDIEERAMEEEEELGLPPSYYLDEADPDVVVLRRRGGTFVAAFSASGATKEGIVGAAEEDRRPLELARRPLPA